MRGALKKILCFCALLLLVSVMSLLSIKFKEENYRRKTLDMLRCGDFSAVSNIEEKEQESLQFIYAGTEKNAEWEQLDIDADGKKEIIYQENNTEGIGRKRILAIFYFPDRKCELLLYDTVDNTEYYFIADSKLVYYAFAQDAYGYELFCVCDIDEGGKIESKMRLEAFDFSNVNQDDSDNDDWWNQENLSADSKGMAYRITLYEDGDVKERTVQEEEYLEIFEAEIGSYTIYGTEHYR